MVHLGFVIEKSRVIKDAFKIRPPEGYKWKLWSYGQYGLTVKLEKVK